MVLRRRHKWWLIVAVAVMLLVVVMGTLIFWPLPTYQGIDYSVTKHTIPAYVKAMEFITRHWRYRELANRIVANRESRHDRVRAIYQWTREHIKPVPAQFPIVDDHIWHIIVRGYGSADQQADVFTTLCVYAGIPAFWRFVWSENGDQHLVLSFVRHAEGWAVFAVAQDWAFYNGQGRLLSMKQLQQMPSRLEGYQHRGIKALSYIVPAAKLKPPEPLRAHLQMPWIRFRYELRKLMRSSWKP